MRVSKLFKQYVELIHKDISNFSLGICSRRRWINKTYPLFNELIFHLEFLVVESFDKRLLLDLYSEGSLFRTFLHFFYCKRSCDEVYDYCFTCSHVRQRNFQNLNIFGDVLLAQRDFESKLGLDDRTVDFDVFLPNYLNFRDDEEGGCMRERVFDFAADIFVVFVSTFIRINLNLYYDFFLKKPLSLSTEKYFIRKIQFFIRDLSNVIWELNVNYFFEIFDKFSQVNRSICYSVPSFKPIKGPYEALLKQKQYYGQLIVVSNLTNDLNSESDTESNRDFDF